ncbi:MAG: hypothetical protein ACUVQ6_07295 [Dissulfurimicrobium sp.]|uniref:hypothetical protein n=1 Tax=Dissulfurimicrobium sp. TaxID=2022436 RepID=UPI00404A2B4B
MNAKKGITLFLDGDSSDLYASLCAIEFAKRVSSDIHAVAMRLEEPIAETHRMKESVSICGRFFADLDESLKMVFCLGDYNGVNLFN